MDAVARASWFREYASRVRARSEGLLIPSIDPEDGAALYAAAMAVMAGRSGAVAVDAGAGIGYSSLWIGEGMEASCGGRCRLVAVEWSKAKARVAEEVLAGAGWSRVEVEVVPGNALDYLSGLPDESLALAFIDIEKEDYPKALRILAGKLEPGGVAAFHNAFFPAPPREFFEAAGEPPWRGGVLPSPAGLLIVVKEPGARGEVRGARGRA